jgi:Zn-dependent peptidase ImmA (M78 family)/transcriptional regulator with XRE-family HTH domain
MASETDAIIGKAVAELRNRLDLSQARLAELASLGHKQIVSQIETGKRSLKAVELVQLASVLHVDANDLLMGEIPPTKPFVLWRGNVAGQRKAEAEAKLHHRCRRYSFLERITGEAGTESLPQHGLDIVGTSFEHAEARGEEVGRALQLGDLPGVGFRAKLESRWRVKLFEDLLDAGSGATTFGDYGPAILENAAEPPSRRTFSLAHELFHLLTWKALEGRALSSDEITRNENLADCFARGLLMPVTAIEERVAGRHFESLVDYLSVARECCVSLPALLWRLVGLGRIEKERVQSFVDTPWGRTDTEWKTPGELDRPLPERYVVLAFTAYVRGDISIGRLSELLETTVGMVEYRLSRYGLDLSSDAQEAALLSS